MSKTKTTRPKRIQVSVDGYTNSPHIEVRLYREDFAETDNIAMANLITNFLNSQEGFKATYRYGLSFRITNAGAATPHFPIPKQTARK